MPTRRPRSSEPVRARARELRRSPTAEERALWQRLRNRQLGVKFRRQVPIGPFIVDFCCHELHLVIELDGEVHAQADQASLDMERTAWLAEIGYRVLRFQNSEVNHDVAAVVSQIRTELPSPAKRERGGG